MTFADWFHKLPREKQDEILEQLCEAMKWLGWSYQKGDPRADSVTREIRELAGIIGDLGLDLESYT